MKNLKLLLMLILIQTHIAYAQPWSTSEKLLLTTWIGTRIVDCGQTHHIVKDTQFHEGANPALANIAESDDKNVYAYFAVGTIVGYLIADALPPKWRKIALSTFIIVQMKQVERNNGIGAGIRF